MSESCVSRYAYLTCRPEALSNSKDSRIIMHKDFNKLRKI